MRPSSSKPRTTSKSRNRDSNNMFKGKRRETKNLPPEETQSKSSNDEMQPLEIKPSKEETSSSEESYKSQIANLQQAIDNLKLENERVQLEVRFSVYSVKSDAKMFQFYTGLPSYQVFKILFDSFGPAAHKLIYSDSNTNIENLTADGCKRGPKRSLTAEEEFFIVLVRLRCGLLEEDIAYRTHLSKSHISRIWITWIDFLHSWFRALPIWPSREVIDKAMPNSFKDAYPTTRVIIDATEIFIEMPSSVRSQSETYSSYKHHNTAKGLIGIAPSGMITFASDLYAGRVSDRIITKDWGILQLLEDGDSVMADKGFDIVKDMPKNTALNIPPFLRDHSSLTIEEETETRRIAAVHVDVERAIRRIKVFRILKTIFPISMAANLNKIYLNKIWIVCVYLTNFLPPLIQE